MIENFPKQLYADMLPVGHCYSWRPEVLWLNVGGEVAIIIAFLFMAPFLFVYARRREDFGHKVLLILFVVVTLLCCAERVLRIWSVWQPAFLLEGYLKVLLGGVAVGTSFIFYRKLPRLLGLPGNLTLEKTNRQLQVEIAEREKAQRALRKANEVLESRVQQRTAQLMGSNRELQNEIKVRKQAEQELKLKNEELNRINNDLDTFVYCASHDLKGPVINAGSLVSMLEQELLPQQNEALTAEVLQRLKQTIVQVQRTIEDLTDISRTHNNVKQEDMEPVQLDAILEDVKTIMLPVIEDTGGCIDADFSNCDAIWFSRKNMRSILFNLVSNALKYHEPGRAPLIRVQAHEEEEYAVLSVSDNGIGIDLNKHEHKLFKLFRRLHDHIEGSGVGLFIVKRLVDNFKGKIEVESEPGIGTTFKVYFPKEKTTTQTIV